MLFTDDEIYSLITPYVENRALDEFICNDAECPQEIEADNIAILCRLVVAQSADERRQCYQELRNKDDANDTESLETVFENPHETIVRNQELPRNGMCQVE